MKANKKTHETYDVEIVSDGVVDVVVVVVVVDEEREQHLVWPWSGTLA